MFHKSKLPQWLLFLSYYYQNYVVLILFKTKHKKALHVSFSFPVSPQSFSFSHPLFSVAPSPLSLFTHSLSISLATIYIS